MKLTLLLVFGLVLVGGVMSMSYVKELGDDETCTKCVDGTKDLNEILVPKLKSFVNEGLKKACKKLWLLKKVCKKYGKKLLDPVVKIVEEYLKGEKLCTYMKVCEAGESDYYSANDFDLSDEKTACVKCQLLVNKAKRLVVHKKELLRDVVMSLLDQCDNEEVGMAQDSCKDMVNAYGVEIVDAAIAEFSEFDACSASEVC